MSHTRLSIDELFSKQAAPPQLFVTISAGVDPDSVIVTPFNRTAACSCGLSITIKKDAIDWIEAGDEVHECCGKQLMVVEMALKDPTLADVFRQLAAHAKANARSVQGLPSMHFSESSLGSPTSRAMGRDASYQRACPYVCMCWPDGCLCYYDCTGGHVQPQVLSASMRRP